MNKDIINLILSKKVLGSVIVIVVFYIIFRLLKNTIHKHLMKRIKFKENNRVLTVSKLITNIIKYFLLLISLMIVLSFAGVDVKALVASFGVFGVVIGLSMQDVLKDLFAGFFIIIENHFLVGDLVEIDGFTGEVIEIGPRSTRIKNFDGNILIIGNRLIEKVVNYSQSRSSVNLKIKLDLENDVNRVRKVIEDFIKSDAQVPGLVGNIKFLGISSINDYLEVFISCETEAEAVFQAERVLNELLLKEFTNNNICLKKTTNFKEVV